jgi:U3 small nucleolar RNA-associated protein 20
VAVVEEEEEEEAVGFKDGQLTLLGLITRMVRLAEDTRFVRQQQRLAALRWIAALVSAAGTAPLLRHLPLLLRPLYRISEASGEQQIHAQAVKASASSGAGAAAGAGGATPEDAVVLSDQVMAHLRGQFGAETMLSAYAAAREGVRSTRAARKTAAARRALLDPEAAARLKLRKGKKKGESRQRKAEERRRVRSARGSGGFGYKASKGGGGGGGGGKGRAGGSGGKGHKLAQKSG